MIVTSVIRLLYPSLRLFGSLAAQYSSVYMLLFGAQRHFQPLKSYCGGQDLLAEVTGVPRETSVLW